MYRCSMTRQNYNLVLNLFVAVIVLATFVLVCYIVYVPYGVRRYHTSSTAYDMVKQWDQDILKNIGIEVEGEESDSNEKEYVHFAQEGRIIESNQEQPEKRKSHFDMLSQEKKQHILSLIPKFSREAFLKSKKIDQKLIRPIPVLSTNFTKQCEQPYCTEFLDKEDFDRWSECSSEAIANATNQRNLGDHSSCHFADQRNRKPVALMSFPGSGNTWVRGLLEAATGLCTGAVYCDVSLRANGFIGEYVSSGRVLVVKTHSDSPQWAFKTKQKAASPFGSAILLVRDPFKALVAEWNRKVSNEFRERTTVLDSHVTAAGAEWFGRNEKWSEFVDYQMGRWQKVIQNWLIDYDQPLLVVQYEDLKDNTSAQITRMLSFLNVDYDSSALDQRLKKGFEAFHRKKHLQMFEHFTAEQRVWVNSIMKDVISLLSFSGKAHLLDVDRYISET